MAGTGVDLFVVSQSQFGIGRAHFGPDGKGSDNWRPWNSIDTEVADSNGSAPGLQGSNAIYLACARSLCGATAGSYQLCQVQGNRRLYHALRRADGLWTPFGDVMNAVPAGGTPPEIISEVAVALINEDLHVSAIDFNGGGRIFHTIRLANGTWAQPFEDVMAAVLAQNPGSLNPGQFDALACADVFGELFLVGAAPPPPGGSGWRLIYTIRHANGTWAPFVDLFAEVEQLGWTPPAGEFTNAHQGIALAELDGQLHLFFGWAVAGPPWGRFKLFHAIRLSFGGWTIPEDVLAVVNLLHPGSWIPPLSGDHIVSASYGGVHVCVQTMDATRPLAHSSWLSLSTSWAPFDATTSEFFWFASDALTNLTYTAMAGSG